MIDWKKTCIHICLYPCPEYISLHKKTFIFFFLTGPLDP